MSFFLIIIRHTRHRNPKDALVCATEEILQIFDDDELADSYQYRNRDYLVDS